MRDQKETKKPSEFICIKDAQATEKMPPWDKITPEEENKYLKKYHIQLHNYESGPLMKSFEELKKRFNASPELLDRIQQLGWKAPSFC